MAIKNLEVDGKKFELSYELTNVEKENTILFLHGWGSNKEIMQMGFKDRLKEFKHIYLDMPGFGKSSNDYDLQTTDYAKIVEKFLNLFALSSKDITIAGHSFGGKVATLLKPKNLILLSTAGIVEEKSTDVKIKIVFAKILRTLGLKKITKLFRSKDVDNMSEVMYATFKNVLNEDFTPYFSSYNGNTLIFWGEKDTATSLLSGKKIASLIKDSKFYSYDGDHYFFLKNSDDIGKKIENGIL